MVLERGTIQQNVRTILCAQSSDKVNDKDKKDDSTKSVSPMFEYLKFDGAPTFDVLAKTKEYVESSPPADPSIYDEKYVLRGPVVGPINRKDTIAAQQSLGIFKAFSEFQVDTFGYTLDPENPYRCFYFQRWRARHTSDLELLGKVYPATDTVAECPVSAFSIVWTPDQKIIYQQVGAVVDRHEGNTRGKGAIFGLLHVAGLKLRSFPGDWIFRFRQSRHHAMKKRSDRSWSKEEDIPSWWVGKSRGADHSDEW